MILSTRRRFTKTGRDLVRITVGVSFLPWQLPNLPGSLVSELSLIHFELEKSIIYHLGMIKTSYAILAKIIEQFPHVLYQTLFFGHLYQCRSYPGMENVLYFTPCSRV